MNYKVFADLAKVLLEQDAHRATKFLSEKETIKATRKLFGGKINKRSKSIEILFTYGTPNYAEREFIKKANKAGEPFPVKKILIKRPKLGGKA